MMLSDDDQKFIAEARARSTLHYYQCYEMIYASDIELTELTPVAEADPDIWVFEDRIDRPYWENMLGHPEAFRREEVYVGWGHAARFLMNDLKLIRYEVDPEFEKKMVSFALLGPVLGILLQLKGYLVLHASGISINGKAAIFVGDKGQGKSTTAAACLARGHRLLTDDLVALELAGDRPVVIPGYPSVKLTQRAVDTLQPPVSSVIRTNIEGFDKDRVRFDRDFDTTRVPAGGVFVLQRGTSIQLEKLAPPEALAELIRFSYNVRFGANMIRDELAKTHFRQCATFMQHVPVYRFTVPETIDGLPEAIAFLEQELQSD
jgi:hypothetical protein